MRGRAINLALAVAFCATNHASADDEINCSGDHRLSFFVAEGKSAYWQEKFIVDGKVYWGGCFYIDGVDIPLSALNDYIDKAKIADKHVQIFHGFGNHCSAGQLLIFDQLKHFVLVVRGDLTSERFQCE